MEKRGVIAEGWTPPELPAESRPRLTSQDVLKQGSVLFGTSEQMADHLTARLAAAAKPKPKSTRL